jgi:hypothetical protein
MRGPTCELWGDDYVPLDLQKQPKAVVLQRHDGNFANMTLEALAAVYPYVFKPEHAS